MKLPSVSKYTDRGGPWNDSIIFLVSQRRFQYDLLTYVLEQEIGAKCLLLENAEQFEALQDTEINPPKLVLHDCFGKNRVTIINELASLRDHEILPQSPLCLFNVRPEIEIETQAVQQGVQGFFYENDRLEHFVKGVHAICLGELWMSRKVMAKCLLINNKKGRKGDSKADSTRLTPRETEILIMISGAASNGEIAEKLCISHHTVKTHVYNIFKKINVPDRFQAALWAAKNL